VRRAGTAGEPSQLAALATFLQRYCPALKSYLVAVKHYPEHEAEDLVQAFVADKIIERNLLEHADHRRGRLRTFLLSSFSNYCISRARTQARRPETLVSLPDEKEFGDTPDILLEAQWARTVVASVLEVMRGECLDGEKMDVWSVFHARTLEPVFSGTTPEPYERLATRLGLASPTQAANLLVTAKRMYARLLRSAIAEYEHDEASIEEEVADLHRCLQPRQNRATVLR
jgi:hypothetical protein